MINERATTSSYFHTITTMKFTVLLAAFAASALGGTIYMAGDSTMATGGWHGLRYCRYALYAESKATSDSCKMLTVPTSVLTVP